MNNDFENCMGQRQMGSYPTSRELILRVKQVTIPVVPPDKVDNLGMTAHNQHGLLSVCPVINAASEPGVALLVESLILD